MKKVIVLFITAFLLISCNKPSISGVVTDIDSYGSVHTSFTIEEMLELGFDYSDIIKVEFENSGTYYMPITTAYTEVGIGKPSYCHYSKTGEASFGYCQGDFHKMCGGEIGEHLKITQYKKHGYAKQYEMIKSVYYYDRELYESAEVFANFRELTTSNIKSKTVYRSGNPMNYVSNPVRYYYVDSLACEVGINTEIDIANTFAKDSTYVTNPEYTGTYCKELLFAGGVVNLGMGSDTFCESAYAKFAQGMRFMIANEPPYLIHCNEGKDRCGFYCMLLEALCGASRKELEYDYMTTFCNLYYFERDTEKYNFNLYLTGDRLLYLMNYPDEMQNPNINWDEAIKELDNINFEVASYNYLTQKCGLTSGEIELLKNKIKE